MACPPLQGVRCALTAPPRLQETPPLLLLPLHLLAAVLTILPDPPHCSYSPRHLQHPSPFLTATADCACCAGTWLQTYASTTHFDYGLNWRLCHHHHPTLPTPLPFNSFTHLKHLASSHCRCCRFPLRSYVVTNLCFNVSILTMIRTVGSVTTTIVGSCLVPLTMLCFTLPLPYLVRNGPILISVGVERMAGGRGGRALGGVQHSSSLLGL